jgi:hypothetical protein
VLDTWWRELLAVSGRALQRHHHVRRPESAVAEVGREKSRLSRKLSVARRGFALIGRNPTGTSLLSQNYVFFGPRTSVPVDEALAIAEQIVQAPDLACALSRVFVGRWCNIIVLSTTSNRPFGNGNFSATARRTPPVPLLSRPSASLWRSSAVRGRVRRPHLWGGHTRSPESPTYPFHSRCLGRSRRVEAVPVR